MAKLLLVVVNETDLWNGRPLYQVVVERLHQLQVAGATAHIGIMGFGHHMRVHHRGLFGIADDRPVTILAADRADRIRAVVPEVRRMVQDGLIALVDAEIIADDAAPPVAPTMPA
jgi:PII-like signaling protein